MVNQVALAKLCAKLIGSVIIAFSALYLFSGQYAFMALMLAVGLAMAIPGLLFVRESNVKFMSRYLLTGANLAVFFMQCISGNYEPAVPLFICLGALSALYFEPGLVKYSFFLSAGLFVVECTYLSLRAGELVGSVMVLGELLIAIFIAFGLTLSTVKTGCKHFNDSTAKQGQTEELLAELDRKNAQTETVLGNQRKLLSEIEQVADDVAAEAQHLSNQTESLASGSTEQADSMEQLASTVDEICRQVRETSDFAQQVRASSETMHSHVETGNDRMTALLTSVRDIESRMKDIETIIKTIDDIAFQTNILALNAAVESARAGSAGKGFAVVADEVRRLAGNSAEAASETIKVLNACREAVKQGVTVAHETSGALEQIRASVSDVRREAFQISDMATAQLERFDSMNQELSRISQVVQSTAAAAQGSAGTVQKLSGQARQLHVLSRME